MAAQPDELVDAVPFRLWVRRGDADGNACAIRFQVLQGKGVLRVSRPGVLIVPPARVRGFEDRLTPNQVRSSQFLHIPGPGRPRITYSLERLDDESLSNLDVEVWHELTATDNGPRSHLDLADTGGIIALGDQSVLPPEPEDTDDLPSPDENSDVLEVAGIVEVVRPPRQVDEDLLDDIVEAEPESVASMLGPIVVSDGDAILAEEDDDEFSADEASADEASADEASADEASADEASANGARPAARLDVGAGQPDLLTTLPTTSDDSEDAEDEPSAGSTALPARPPMHVEGRGVAARDLVPVGARPGLVAGPNGSRMLVRHLRWELERKRLENLDLRNRLARLEQRLRDLGVDPDE